MTLVGNGLGPSLFPVRRNIGWILANSETGNKHSYCFKAESWSIEANHSVLNVWSKSRVLVY